MIAASGMEDRSVAAACGSSTVHVTITRAAYAEVIAVITQSAAIGARRAPRRRITARTATASSAATG